MKTIEIVTEKINYKQLIKKIYNKFLLNDDKFHFFYEPQLIIRLSEEKLKIIKEYLNKKKIEYKIYPYPYPKKGKYKESKRYKNINLYLNRLYNLQALLYFKSSKKQLSFVSNRLHHCFLNICHLDFYEESKYYLSQAKGYMKHEYKSDGKSTIYISYLLIKLLHKIL